MADVHPTTLATPYHQEGRTAAFPETPPSLPEEATLISIRSYPLSSDTGVLNAVTIQPEGHDSTDLQDAQRTHAEARRSGQPVALIVEDTLELAEVLMTTLQRMNVRTVHESNGSRAFARFDELRPDVMLLDLGLPDMPGWKVLDTLKERHQQDQQLMPAVIIITASGDPANRLVGKLQGVYSYLVKPFTPDEVEHVIKTALAQRAGS